VEDNPFIFLIKEKAFIIEERIERRLHMDFFAIISEERIKKGYKEGEFENLPGFGKPLPHDELSHVPDDLRMAYRVMKNAGYTDEDSALKQEMSTIEDLIQSCEDPAEKKELQKRLNQKLLQFNSMMSKRRNSTNSSIFKNYEDKINHKLFK
jgi:hypothetical protein